MSPLISGYKFTKTKNVITNTIKLSINPLDSLRFRLYGQKCKISEGCDNEEFQNPKWYREEVEKVLNNVHNKIGEVGGLKCYVYKLLYFEGTRKIRYLLDAILLINSTPGLVVCA